MNRRSFLRSMGLVAGAAVVAPKVLAEALPAPAVAEVLAPVEVAVTIAGLTGNVFAMPSDFGFYGNLVKLCIQFFGQHSFYITEDYKEHIVNIQTPTIEADQMELFKEGLWWIKPCGMLVTINGEAIPYKPYLLT